MGKEFRSLSHPQIKRKELSRWSIQKIGRSSSKLCELNEYYITDMVGLSQNTRNTRSFVPVLEWLRELDCEAYKNGTGIRFWLPVQKTW